MTDFDECAGRGLVRQSRRGITRPSASGASGTSATPPATSSSTVDDPRSAEPLLFTAEQAASLLQVRPSWLRRKAAARAVPCRFVGKHLRFSRADIEAIAEGNTP
ncbi:MAG: helix-turn-helix domain-containing protein [Actinophytocola sp.]|uniref:helix-turn-helix domain-containing protein n=1 Tax=Actinophytocola sp. TaxID=1872138 RepID=UPI003C78A6C2